MSNEPPGPSPRVIDRGTARRYHLAAQGLRPPRMTSGKHGVSEVFRSIRSVQFDPINLVGRNPDLVLQSRVKDYRPEMLDELLYQDRLLWDGWDKMACIYPREDWRYFSRYRERMADRFGGPEDVVEQLGDYVRDQIRAEGPQSSLDFDHEGKTSGGWGSTRTVRKALDGLFKMGRLGIDHRVNNRRYFDLMERLQPPKILESGDPHPEDEDYQRWHLARRVSSLKLAHPHAGVQWSGIEGVKTRRRRKLLSRMAGQGRVVPVSVEGIPRGRFYVPAEELDLLKTCRERGDPVPEAAVVAPLDNLLWDRQVVKWVFDFHYVWEVYKPREDREYGYYVLPVLYDDRFVGRFEPEYDRQAGILEVKNWWWEGGVQPDPAMKTALISCLRDFQSYLGAERVRQGPDAEGVSDLDWLEALEG